MITAEKAREILDAHLAVMKAYPDDGDTAVMISVTEHRFGWEFRYQSSKWARTRDSRDMWVGTGPIVVDRRDGRLLELGGRQFGDMVAVYQQRYDREMRADEGGLGGLGPR
ncbi:YrhB domain-containing protein [Kitasatospora sp. NPDC091207]|uniref:YrhB domain-containing protein n=1 Tax=Kitasatospora sp. NPDC091207 TaxID=3364083 RepID=UPI003810664E